MARPLKGAVGRDDRITIRLPAAVRQSLVELARRSGDKTSVNDVVLMALDMLINLKSRLGGRRGC